MDEKQFEQLMKRLEELERELGRVHSAQPVWICPPQTPVYPNLPYYPWWAPTTYPPGYVVTCNRSTAVESSHSRIF